MEGKLAGAIEPSGWLWCFVYESLAPKAFAPRVDLAGRLEMRKYLREVGSHPGNPG
jgi:hypothetical protein